MVFGTKKLVVAVLSFSERMASIKLMFKKVHEEIGEDCLFSI